ERAFGPEKMHRGTPVSKEPVYRRCSPTALGANHPTGIHKQEARGFHLDPEENHPMSALSVHRTLRGGRFLVVLRSFRAVGAVAWMCFGRARPPLQKNQPLIAHFAHIAKTTRRLIERVCPR